MGGLVETFVCGDVAKAEVARHVDDLDAELHELTVDGLVNLLRIHGQNASRLGRLLRDKRALSGEAADGISAAISQALDELSTELGIDL